MKPEDTKELIQNSKDLKRTVLGTRKSRLDVEETVAVDDNNRLTHVLNTGATGTGKTTLIIHAALQDIYKERGVAVVNPAGDAIDRLLHKYPENRIDDLVYLNPNEEPVTKINILQPVATDGLTKSQLNSHRELIVSDVVDLFRRFNVGDWGPRWGQFLSTLTRALVDNNIRYQEGNTLVDMYQAVVDNDELSNLIDRTDNQYIRNQLIRIKEDMGTYELEPLQRRLNTWVQNDSIREIIDAQDTSIDFKEIVYQGKVLLVDLKREHIGDRAAEIIGSTVASQVWAAAQSRIALPEQDRSPFYLYVDEAHQYGGDGSSFSQYLAEARKYGLGLWISSQFLHQLEPEMRQAVLSNARTKIFLNQEMSEDTTKIAGLLPGINKEDLTSIEEYRAIIRQPSSEPTVFDILPPWQHEREEDELEQIKRNATIASEEERQTKAVNDLTQLGAGDIAGQHRHTEMLLAAKEYLENRSEVVRVNLIHQEAGKPQPDGEIIKNQSVAHLEAELSTLSKPGKVLNNLKKAVDQNRKCVFVVQEGTATRLESILQDPVNRKGNKHQDEHGGYDYYTDDEQPFTETDTIAEADYRILVVTPDNKVYDYAKNQELECPELNPPETTENELTTACVFRDKQGYCTALDTQCLLVEP